MRHAITLQLLGGLVVLGGAVANATTPVFETWALPVTADPNRTGVTEEFYERIPVWWDVTLDGDPDLVFVSGENIRRLHLTDSGALGAADVRVSDSDSYRGGWALTPIDIDDDGTDELLLIAYNARARIFRVTEPDVIEEVALPLPAFRVQSVNDVAVGDLNRDGLPDVVLTMGRANTERANVQGRETVLLMNRGGGRFEAIEQPLRTGRTMTITLADIDGDGWLDAVESVDASSVSGPSRLLMNRTQAGDTTPTFAPSEHLWDSGTSGMGVAVADIDGDGHLDMYNTSVGHDLLVMGLGEGRFRDETYERGILHQFSSLGMRVQWSPSFADFNADGRLDLLVRHGVPWSFNPAVVSSWAADLLYTQGADGAFERVVVPTEPDFGDGAQFAVGDLEGDGLPDIARDGMQGHDLFWHNVTPTAAGTRTLTVRLSATVSGSPPTGAIIEGSCGGTTLTRHITSGGKMGANAASEAHLGWEDCADEAVQVRVRWPSGAVTTDDLVDDVTVWRAEEPRWFEAGSGDAITLDPAGAGTTACAVTTDGVWTCCESLCEVDRPATGPATLRLDDHTPMTLPAREASWLLVTTPHLPRPGEDATLHVLHVGAPETFPGEAAVLDHGGETLSWDSVDATTRAMTAVLRVADDATTLPLTLRLGDEQVAAWSPSVGFVFDSADPWHDLYPFHATTDALKTVPWEVHLYPMPGVDELAPGAALTLTTSDGAAVPILETVTEPTFRRIKLSVAWEELEGVDTLLVRDHPLGAPVAMPVFQPDSDADLNERIDRVECGILRNRMEPIYGGSLGILTFLDATGVPLPISPAEIHLEIEGAELDGEVVVYPFMKDAIFVIRTGEATGPGQVIVRREDGEELGRCEFTVVQWPTQPMDLAQSWTTLSRTEIDRGKSESTRLRIGVNNAFGELIGSDVWPTVLLQGGTWTEPLLLNGAGTISGTIVPTAEDDTIQITVTLDGQLLDTYVVSVTDTATGGGESTDEGGCATSHPSRHLALTMAAMLGLLWARRRRPFRRGRHPGRG